LTHPQLTATMKLPYAQTYASCQGTEFEGTLAIHDSENKHFTMRHLFVALSRAKRSADVSVL
jgi:ATP-dependent exoDNAse (exonuclease V) alpha subunit